MPNYGDAIAVHGFEELQRALERVEGSASNYGVEYELQRRLRVIGEKVAAKAPEFVTHKTGRHGDPGQPALEDSVRVSVTKKRASVYSTAIFGGAQNFGAGPKAGWAGRGPHIQRKNASKWMSKAVAAERDATRRELDGLLDWVVNEVERR